MLRARIKSGATTVGSWLTIGHSAIAEIIAKAGFDWLVVDLEHSVISIETAGDLIRTIDLCGVSPLVRLTSNNQDQIKRVMDAGAHGIVVPMVNTAEDARRAVAAVHYGPIGIRGVGLGRAQGYWSGFKSYLEWQLDGPFVAVMIEHKSAIPNLAEIFSVPGVDAYFIGPYDLSCSIGVPGQFDHPDFRSALAMIRKAGIQTDVAPGLHVVEPQIEQLRQAIGEGYRFIAYGVDIRFLDVEARRGTDFIRGLKT
jgi:2-keto-3-deoxy-L-rhamnonate aldolase RhmA